MTLPTCWEIYVPKSWVHHILNDLGPTIQLSCVMLCKVVDNLNQYGWFIVACGLIILYGNLLIIYVIERLVGLNISVTILRALRSFQNIHHGEYRPCTISHLPWAQMVIKLLFIVWSPTIFTRSNVVESKVNGKQGKWEERKWSRLAILFSKHLDSDKTH